MLLVEPLAPLVDRLEGREDLDVEEAGRVGAVARPALVRDHGDDLGHLGEDLAQPLDVGVARLERDRGRHGAAHVEVALLELGQEFQAEILGRDPGDQQDRERHADRQHAVAQAEAQDDLVAEAQNLHDQGVALLHVLRQDHRRERGRDREGGEQAADQRVGVGLGHRPEDVALDARHREQRQEADDDDRRREEDRPVHLGAGDGDGAEPPGQAARRRLTLGMVRLGQMPEHVLDHDDGGVDDQAEIDGAERQQVGRVAAHHEDQDGEAQRERDRRRHDDRAAERAQEQPLHHEHQHHAEDEVVHHRVGRGVDQAGAIVDPLDLHARAAGSSRR